MEDYKALFEQSVRQLAEIDSVLGVGCDGCSDTENTLDAIASLVALRNIVSHDGFFRIERGSRVVGFCESVTHWSIGVGLHKHPGRVSWWHGDTLDDVVSKALPDLD